MGDQAPINRSTRRIIEQVMGPHQATAGARQGCEAGETSWGCGAEGTELLLRHKMSATGKKAIYRAGHSEKDWFLSVLEVVQCSAFV